MKKFKIIRNILIVLILILAVIYIGFVRTKNIEKSKLYKMCQKMDLEKGTIILKHKDENQEIILCFGVNRDSHEGVTSIYRNDYKYHKNDDKDFSNPSQTVSIINYNKGEKMYTIFPEAKKYRISYDSEEIQSDAYNIWLINLERLLQNNKYYTRGIETYNGKLYYVENFKDAGIKAYFEKGKLVYLMDKEIDASFDNAKDRVYETTAKYDDSYNEIIKIPDDYTQYTVDEEGKIIEMNEE